MSFRKITFLFIGLLLSSLLLLQFWLIQNFTQDVSSKIGQAAFEVSRSTIETLLFRKPQLQFKRFAFKGKLSEQSEVEILNSLSTLSNQVNISLQDGKTDNFLTINSSGTNYKVDIPRTGIQKSLDDMSNKILLSALAFIGLGLIAAGFFSRKLSQPLKLLQEASQRVGRGEFGFQVKASESFQTTELKNTVDAFNEMSNKIEKLKAENEVLQKQSQLSELSEITRGLAHTIRNPLNTLNLVVDELVSSEKSQTKEDLNRIAKHQIQRIDKWVHSLMEVMSTDTSLVELVNLKEILGSVVDDIQLNLNKNVKIDFQVQQELIDDNQECCLQAIKPELKSLLHSLIVNAVEATDTDNQNTNQVNIKLEKIAREIKITITDHGVGLSEEIESKLFSPHNTNKTYGAGMGLYLAHRIITLKYSGDINISNNPNSTHQCPTGTQVVLTLNNRV